MGRVRTLLLLRHAKSSWDDPTLEDFERPLAPRGRRAAQRVAEHAKATRLRPALVLCSPARRARETLDLVLPGLGEGVDVRIEDGLYGADAEQLLDRLRAVDRSVDTVLLIGHNPGLQDIGLVLAGDGEEDALHQLRSKFPTGALATLEFDVPAWTKLGRGRAYLARFIAPKALPSSPAGGR